jgi:hypothetical protein
MLHQASRQALDHPTGVVNAVAIPSSTRELFAHFQNLNLLVLLEDLRLDRPASGAWSTGTWLCPVAHGLSAGRHVEQLKALGQTAEPGLDCCYAASDIGADPGLISRFVRSWDEKSFGPKRLLQQLEELWQERLDDAEAVQEVLHCAPLVPARRVRSKRRTGA